MERVRILIDKLREQQERGDKADKILLTVQELYSELQRELPVKESGSKVSVVMPFKVISFPESKTGEEKTAGSHINEAQKVQEPMILPSTPEEEEKVEKPAVVEFADSIDKKEPAKEPQVSEKTVEKPEPYILKKPTVTDKSTATPTTDTPKTKSHTAPEFPFDALEDVPTLSQQPPQQKELHEVISEKKASLNDALRQEKKEVAHTLKDAPIKDLRKGIALNDKFVFINELFRGDEAMYDRSIKTINAFAILQEAEYWINRELKVKLGWNDSKEVVQHFYQVVRRRFS